MTQEVVEVGGIDTDRAKGKIVVVAGKVIGE